MDRQSKRLARVVKQLAGARSKSNRASKSVRSKSSGITNGFSRPVQAPVSSTSVYTAPPKAAAQIISHREYVNDVVSSASAGAFGGDTYSINPGNALLFPWLSQIAQAYEEYEILSMKFIYRKLAASNVQGLTMMAVQYDSYDPVFASKAEMQDYAGARSTAVWNDLEFDIDVKAVRDRQKVLYVLPPGASPSGDSREYYAGNFTIATSNLANGSANVGELLVQYSIRFTKPLLSSVSGAGPLAEEEATASGFTPASASNLFSSAGVVNFNTGTPFKILADSHLQSNGVSAALTKASKWLLSTGYFGTTSGGTPTFSSGTTLGSQQAGLVATDVSGGEDFAFFDPTSKDFGDIRHFTLDFSKVTDTAVSSATNLFQIVAPVWTGATGQTGTGVSAAVLTKISNSMYQNLVNPVPGSRRHRDCPLSRHVLRLPSNFRQQSFERQKNFVAPIRAVESKMAVGHCLEIAPLRSRAPAPQEGKEQDFEMIETGIARAALRTDFFESKSSGPQSSSTKGTPVRR